MNNKPGTKINECHCIIIAYKIIDFIQFQDSIKQAMVMWDITKKIFFKVDKNHSKIW